MALQDILDVNSIKHFAVQLLIIDLSVNSYIVLLTYVLTEKQIIKSQLLIYYIVLAHANCYPN